MQSRNAFQPSSSTISVSEYQPASWINRTDLLLVIIFSISTKNLSWPWLEFSAIFWIGTVTMRRPFSTQNKINPDSKKLEGKDGKDLLWILIQRIPQKNIGAIPPNPPVFVPVHVLENLCHFFLLSSTFAPLLANPVSNGQICPLRLFLNHAANPGFRRISQFFLGCVKVQFFSDVLDGDWRATTPTEQNFCKVSRRVSLRRPGFFFCDGAGWASDSSGSAGDSSSSSSWSSSLTSELFPKAKANWIWRSSNSISSCGNTFRTPSVVYWW